MIALLSVFFLLVTLLSIYLFWRATGKSKILLFAIAAWMLVQGILGLTGFYANTTAMPPRVLFQPVLPLLAIVFMFIIPGGRRWADAADLSRLMLVHTIRIGAEITIYGLIVGGLMPEILSVGGRNFDILAGVTAPLIYYFVFVKKLFGRRLLLLWNILCLGLLLNVVIHAALSVPSPVQQFGLSVPNVAVLRFPFNYLPSVVVPLVMLSHLLTIRNLLKAGNGRIEI